MRRRLRSIRSRLFLSYSLVIVALVVVFLASFTVYTSRLLIDRASRSSAQLADSVSAGIDAQIATMNKISVNVAFSVPVNESFARFRAAGSPIVRYNAEHALNNLLFAIIGPMLPVYQVNLYDLTGRSVGAGFAAGPARFTGTNPDWRPEALKREGARLVTAPFTDQSRPSGGSLLSLCRVYYDRSSALVGFIEVQQRYDMVFGGIAATQPDTRVFVFDEAGHLLYPPGGAGVRVGEAYGAALRGRVSSGTPLSLRDPLSAEPVLIGYALSDLTGWSAVVVDSQSKLLAPVASFTQGVAIAGIAALLLVLAVSYLLSRRFGAPIRRLYDSVRSLRITESTVHPGEDPMSGIDELDALSQSFTEMRGRLQRNVGELLQAKSQEMRARMLALQSQMNPHFLYNTISTIGILAEDGRTSEIIGMCDELSRMLRYVAVAEPSEVTLSEEIEHTRHFLNLMHHRYEDQLSYCLEVPDALMDLPVPRLSIQPLVENSLKHGIHVAPPWRVSVVATRDDGRWMVSVRDNGTGFAAETLTALRGRLEALDVARGMPEAQFPGIGIMSIFLRLKLLHGEESVFRIGNGPQGGAVVEFGAPIGS